MGLSRYIYNVQERYNFYVKTKQLISLGNSFSYELELKGTSYSNFLTDTFRTVTTPNAIFALYLSFSLKLIFFYYRKMLPTSCV